jgi:hypothetical protein
MHHRVWLVATGLALTLGIVACETGEPGVKNSFGTLDDTMAASPQEITAAAAEVLKEMELIIVTNNATDLDGRVIARTAQDDRVKVDVERVNDEVSKVAIRVGTWGDEGMSMTIRERIRGKLGKTPAKPADAP